MPIPIVPEADLRKELRNMVAKQKRDLLENWERSIAEMEAKLGELIPEGSHPDAAELNAKMERKLIEAIDRMKAKAAAIHGGFEQFFAFIDNAQFPDGAA